MTTVFFVLGLIALVIGAELLVRGAARIAIGLGITPLVIGLTVVSFGTSAPEFAVSISSSLDGQTGVALGNAIGSNIFNVLLILGISAMIIPLTVSKQLIRMDVPVMIAISLATFLLALDTVITRIEGAILLAGLVVYTAILIFVGRKESRPVPAVDDVPLEKPASVGSWLGNVTFVIAGLFLLVLGARWMVDSAITFAEFFGLSDTIIGLTIVAGGTSLPELITTVVASIRGQRDIAVGNVVGSNVFNMLGVLGVGALAAPSGLEVLHGVLYFDFPVMLASSIVCLPIFFTGARISRGEGLFFFASYVAYTCYLILAANHQ